MVVCCEKNLKRARLFKGSLCLELYQMAGVQEAAKVFEPKLRQNLHRLDLTRECEL